MLIKKNVLFNANCNVTVEPETKRLDHIEAGNHMNTDKTSRVCNIL